MAIQPRICAPRTQRAAARWSATPAATAGHGRLLSGAADAVVNAPVDGQPAPVLICWATMCSTSSANGSPPTASSSSRIERVQSPVTGDQSGEGFVAPAEDSYAPSGMGPWWRRRRVGRMTPTCGALSRKSGDLRQRGADDRNGRGPRARRRKIGSCLASASAESDSDRFAIAFHASGRSCVGSTTGRRAAPLASSRQRRRASFLRSRAHVVPMHRMQRLRPSGTSAGRPLRASQARLGDARNDADSDSGLSPGRR